MKTVGISVNTNFISEHSKYFRNALVLASCYSRSKLEYLLNLIKDVSAIQKVTNENEYKTIEGYEVEKYTYSYHTINELKTIKSLQELEKRNK